MQAVVPEVLYSISGLAEAAGIKPMSVRSARRQGLPVRYALGKGWVLGRDFIEWVAAQTAIPANRRLREAAA